VKGVSKVKRHKYGKTTVIVILLALVCLFYVSPVFWMISTAFKRQEHIVSSPVYFLPPEITWYHVKNVFIMYGGFKSIKDSLIIASITTIICLVVGSFAAYSLARFRTGGRNLAFWILSNRMLPPVVFVIPFFLLFKTFHLIDTHAGLILSYLTFNLPFSIWILRGFFSQIPKELDESAMIDGARRITILLRIVLPLAGPGIVATALFVFVFSWNEFLYALLLTRGGVRTLPVLIPQLYGGHDILYGEVSAITIFAIVPIIVLIIFFQRYLVRGLTLGAVEG
jgi:multiple sugar transport system permease protein